METETLTIDAKKFNQLLHDVTLIKNILVVNQNDAEGELTESIKKELAEARRIPDSENISLEELEAQIALR